MLLVHSQHQDRTYTGLLSTHTHHRYTRVRKQQHVDYKMALLVYKSLNRLVPQYRANDSQMTLSAKTVSHLYVPSSNNPVNIMTRLKKLSSRTMIVDQFLILTVAFYAIYWTVQKWTKNTSLPRAMSFWGFLFCNVSCIYVISTTTHADEEQSPFISNSRHRSSPCLGRASSRNFRPIWQHNPQQMLHQRF